MSSSNLSYDLIWAVSRKNSNYLVKRSAYGGAYFSTEPLNSTGVYTKGASGFANSHAHGVVKTADGLKLLTKENKNFNKPAKAVEVTPFNPTEALSKKTEHDELDAAITKGLVLEKVQL